MQPEFGRVAAPFWSDQPVIVVGTGPSLAGFCFDRLKGLGHVLAVKQAYHDLPFAEACFGLDIPWMRHHADELARLAKRMPVYLALPDQDVPIDPIEGATYLRRLRSSDLMSTEPDAIQSGGNSGFGAVNLALLKRAKQIVLFGFDYSGAHWCPDRYVTRPEGLNNRYWPRWAVNFSLCADQIKAMGVEVINASPGSTVEAFPKVSHDEALQHLDRLGRS